MFFEKLNLEHIKQAIEPAQQTRLTSLTILDTVDSTNSYLLTQAKAGAPSGTVCLAEQQTAGRGRRGRVWVSPPGANIYCSLLWRFPDEKNISSLSIAVAVMVANVLQQYGAAAGIELKWPNDVLFAGRKLAGILLERNDRTGVVIGIGLNLLLPTDAKVEWTAVQEISSHPVQRNYLTGLLLNELLLQLPVYQSRGLQPFIASWRRYDVLCGQAITVHTSEQIWQGVMQGINTQGELLLDDAHGDTITFCYGEVSVRKQD